MVKKEQVALRCGHEMDTPDFMGRGQARVRRIKEFTESHSCPDCTINGLFKHASSLFAIIGKDEMTGKFISRPYNQAEIEEYVAKKSLQLRW